MAQDTINLEELFITPLVKGMTKGVFPIPEPEFEHLTNWFNTKAVHAQRDKKSKTYVALHNGTVIGYVTLTMSYLEVIPGIIPLTKGFSYHLLHIGKLYIHPSYRGHGVGKLFMDFALDIAQHVDEMIGCVGLVVDANKNEGTIRFYERYGFQTIETKGPTQKMFFKIV